MFENFQNKKFKKKNKKNPKLDELKNRKGVDFGVKLPWFRSWLFQVIHFVILGRVALPLVPASPPLLTGGRLPAVVASLGRIQWELFTQIRAPRKCSGKMNYF